MFLFELSALGAGFALTLPRLVANIPGIILIGWALEKLIGRGEQERIREAMAAM